MSVLDILIMTALAVWILVGIGLLVGFAQAFPLMRRWRRTLRKIDRVADVLDRHLEPVLHQVGRIADDLQVVTDSLRSDADQVEDTVERAARSATRVIRIVENRVAELDGLLELAQEEAEQSFLSAASVFRTLRGLRDRFAGGARRTEEPEERRRSG